MREVRPRALLIVLIVTMCSGCYASHGRFDPPDAGARMDSGISDGGARDAGRLDSGRSDGGARDTGFGFCRPAVPSTVCVDDALRPFLSSVGPTSLRLWSDTCHCMGTLTCEARVMGDGVFIDVLVCDEAPCGACTGPNEVRCEIPAVSPGLHFVYVNDELSFELHAMETGGVPPTALCQHVGSSGGGLCDFPGDLRAWRPDRVCFRDRSPAGAIDIVFEKDDTACIYEPGPCDVYASSGGLEIRPRVRSCDEGTSTWGCRGTSDMLRRTCRLLDVVPPGPLPMFLQDGTSLGTITITDGAMSPVECRPIAP